MHVRTSLKYSWGNWFLIVDDQRSNLFLLRTLHEFAPVLVKQKLHKLLYLELVLNKDSMVVEPILRITQPRILRPLESISYVPMYHSRNLHIVEKTPIRQVT